jgi:FkbM family methyltransferase
MVHALLRKILGSHNTYRLGRFLYMHSRGDGANRMSTNGELMIQRHVVKATKDAAYDKLVCFDVGANVGDWSSALLCHCEGLDFPALELHVFEPVPATEEALRRRLGQKRSVHYQPLALSSTIGPAAMYVSGETSGTNSLHSSGRNALERPISVRKGTVTDFCAANDIQSIHLLKIDTEGHDYDVILGTLPLLKEGRVAALQFEYNHRWIFSRHYLKDVFDAIHETPYVLGKVCMDHVEVYDRWHPEHERFFEANYILMRLDVLSWFPIRHCHADAYNALVISQ